MRREIAPFRVDKETALNRHLARGTVRQLIRSNRERENNCCSGRLHLLRLGDLQLVSGISAIFVM